MIKIGNINIGSVYIGNIPINTIYNGNDLIYNATKAQSNYILYKTNLTDEDATIDVRFQDWQSVIVCGCTGDEFKQIEIPEGQTHFGGLFRFAPAEALTEVDMSNVNTKITVGHTMFFGCSNLTSCNVANLDVSECVSLGNTFEGCSLLTELDLENWECHNLDLFYCTFSGCTNLQYLNCPKFDFTENYTENKYWFSGCSSLNHIRCKQSFKDWCITNQDEISLPDAMREGGNGTWEIIDLENDNNYILYKTNLTDENATINIYYNWGEHTVNGYTGDKFYKCEMEPIQNLGQLFRYAPATAITEVDLSYLNTSENIQFECMFIGCENLTNVKFGNIDSSKVIAANNLFTGCSSLTTVDMSGIVMPSVYNFYAMFEGCSSLTTLYFDKIDVSTITEFPQMFNGCSSLNHIRCKQSFKDWCWEYQDNINLPTAMREGGRGTWEIVD